MFEYPLFIAEGKQNGSIAVAPRINIHNSGETVHYPKRFGYKIIASSPDNKILS